MGKGGRMTDREKLEKILEFVTEKEDKFYKPIEDGKYEPGSLGAINYFYMQKISIQKILIEITNLNIYQKIHYINC